MKALKITCTGMERLELDNTLAALQEQVEGYIEVFHFGRKDARGICNENGIAMGLPLNLPATLMTDIALHGTVLLVGIDPDDPFAEDFCDCPGDLLAFADEYRSTKEKTARRMPERSQKNDFALHCIMGERICQDGQSVF